MDWYSVGTSNSLYLWAIIGSAFLHNIKNQKKEKKEKEIKEKNKERIKKNQNIRENHVHQIESGLKEGPVGVHLHEIICPSILHSLL